MSRPLCQSGKWKYIQGNVLAGELKMILIYKIQAELHCHKEEIFFQFQFG